MGGDGLLHDHAGTSRTGEGQGCDDNDCTDNDKEQYLPDNRRSLPSSTGVRSRPPHMENAPQVFSEAVVHNRHLCRYNYTARRTASMTNQSCQPQPPLMNHVSRSPVKFSANALIIMATAHASTSIYSNSFTSAQPIYSPQCDDWKPAMEEECKSSMHNNTSTIINSWEGRQLRVRAIGSKWV